MRGCWKFLIFLFVMMLFVLHHSLVSIVIWDEKKRMRYFLRSISLTAKLGLWILNVQVQHLGSKKDVRQRLIVSNHLSYLDVLVLFAHYPALFITSTEIRDTFLLGRICRLAGCFFVERRKSLHTSLTKETELSLMKMRLSEGHNVFLFPEGTSSDGSQVLPFKGTFFQLAVETHSKVQLFCLKYTGPFAHIPPWHGDMGFASHLYKLCCLKKIPVILDHMMEITAPGKMELAKLSHHYIREAYEKN